MVTICHPHIHTDKDTAAMVDALDRLLRFELAAAEVYGLAVGHAGPLAERTLHALGAGHEQRAHQLRSAIESLGGDPARGAGHWGVQARMAIGAAKLLGARRVLATLVEVERNGLSDYRQAMAHLAGHDVATRLMVEQEKALAVIRRARPLQVSE